VKSQTSSLGKSKHKRSIKYIAIEEKAVAFVSLLCNRTKPLPVTLSTVKEYAEQVAKNLGGMALVSVKLHGKTDEVDREPIKKRILEI